MNCPKCGWTPPQSSYKVGNDMRQWINIYPQSRLNKRIKPTTKNPHGKMHFDEYHYCPDHGEYRSG